MRRGRPIHVGGTAPDKASSNWLEVFFESTTGRRFRCWKVRIENTDGLNDLELSFDRGNNFTTIEQGAAPYEGEHDLRSFHVRGDGTCTFKAIGTSYG